MEALFEEPQNAVVARTHIPLFDGPGAGECRCSKCGLVLPLAGCKKIGSNTHTCNQCGRVALVCCRRLSGYTFLNNLPAGSREAFWRKARTLTPAGIADLAVTIQAQHRTLEADVFENGGEYLPLSVWSKRGFVVNMAMVQPEARGWGWVEPNLRVFLGPLLDHCWATFGPLLAILIE
jgi:hypothetical protein